MTPDLDTAAFSDTLLRHENAFSVYKCKQRCTTKECRAMQKLALTDDTEACMGTWSRWTWYWLLNQCMFFYWPSVWKPVGNLVDAASAQPYGVQCHKSDYNLHPSLTCLRIAQDMGIKQHSTLKWSLPWNNIPNGLACRPNPSQCSDKQPMLRDIPKHKKWQWIRCLQPMAITESLRVWTAVIRSPPVRPRKSPRDDHSMRTSSPRVVSRAIFSLATSNQGNYPPYQMWNQVPLGQRWHQLTAAVTCPFVKTKSTRAPTNQSLVYWANARLWMLRIQCMNSFRIYAYVK